MKRDLTDEERGWFQAPDFAWVITVQPDGSPQASLTWIDHDETHLLVNTAVGRVKDRNVERDPRVTIALQRGGDAYVWLAVTGVVEDREIGEAAEAHIDHLARAYDGRPWAPVEGQVRVRWRVAPIDVVRYGE